MIAKRLLPVVALTLAFLGASPVFAQSAAENGAARDNAIALELYDLGEYPAAVAKLEGALKLLADQGMAQRPVAAQTHVVLGLVKARGLGDEAGALAHFRKAAGIDAGVALPAGHADEITSALFAKAYEEVHPTIDCNTLMGVAHQQLVVAREGETPRIEAQVGKILQEQSTLLILYRGPEGGDFAEAPMVKGEGCTYRAEIPTEAVVAPKLEYYLLARLEDGRLAARRGKAEEPFVVNVSFGTQDSAPQVEDSEELPEENPIDEVPAALARPEEPKGSGCAGCTAGGADAGGAGLLLLLALVALRRRSA